MMRRSLPFPRPSHLSRSRLPSILPHRSYSTALPTTDLVRLSTLPNGIKVATEATPGHFIGAGVYVQAGSRWESARCRGATHLTDRMAFKSTKHRTAAQMSLEIESLGSSFSATSGRDVIMFQATSYPSSLPSVISVLSDTVLHPNLLPTELDAEKDGAQWEISEMKKKPEFMLPELVHEVGWRGNTVGLPLVCPEERLGEITVDTLREYRDMWFKPERMVVAGVGVQHEVFLEQVAQHFESFTSPRSTLASSPTIPPHLLTSNTKKSQSQLAGKHHYATTAYPPVSPTTGLPLQSFDELSSARPQYTGGSQLIDTTHTGTDDPLAHLYVGFEASGVHDEDLYALACLHVLLGGGSSFSAGGPGKGMYSRLYTGVLNRHYDVDYCQAFHHSYSDTGLFGLAISCTPQFLPKVPGLIASQLDQITRKGVRGELRKEEVERAKCQLKSSVLFGLESRSLQVEDLGRQVQAAGRKIPLSEISAKIDALTIEDLQSAASRILRPEAGGLGGEPTIVGMGRLSGLSEGMVEDALKRVGIGSVGGGGELSGCGGVGFLYTVFAFFFGAAR